MSLNKVNQELIALLESTSNSSDKLIEEKERIIRDLIDLLERSANNSKICIVEKNKTIDENDRIIAKKDNKIAELQNLLQCKVLNEPLTKIKNLWGP